VIENRKDMPNEFNSLFQGLCSSTGWLLQAGSERRADRQPYRGMLLLPENPPRSIKKAT
jgi:hypothetical protein